MSPDIRDQQWRSTAEQASKEMDGKKLSFLVEQLLIELDEHRNEQGASLNVGGVAH